MHSLITSYFLQSKHCVLPGIGVLKLIHRGASTDAANHILLPPNEEIIFTAEDHSTSPALVKYIADKKQIDKSEAENLLDNFCREWKEKIEAGEKLNFEVLGSIMENENGKIIFEREQTINFLQPISIDTAYKKAGEEEKSVVDETNSNEPADYKEEVVMEKSYWGFWALILVAVAALIIFYHFKDQTISISGAGNQNHLSVDSSKATYNTPDK